MTDSSWCLGLDSSTQGLKAVAIDDSLTVCYEQAVNFDADLPDYQTEGGAHIHADGKTVTAPALMWVEALDLLLARMKQDGFPFGRVAAISGSGQQHGSVWLNGAAEPSLAGLRDGAPLAEQLKGIFSIEQSPIWMDSSTTAECRALEDALGGPQAVATITGSRAYERFTGNQIAKIFKQQPDAYEATRRIALVSSFMASLLLGKVAPIDASDGSGMNLMNIRTRSYDPAALSTTAPGLEARLGDIVPSHHVIGPIHSYFASTYGFADACVVVAFSGDNPNSLAGLRLDAEGDIAVSLGTSDTLFGTVANPSPSGEEGHVFVHPAMPESFMVMLVHQNGSRTRERVRDDVAGGSWETFREYMRQTPPGNGGRLGLYIDTPEITPPIDKTGVTRWGPGRAPLPSFPPEAETRAVVEGQFLSLRLHAEQSGIAPRRVVATGGASVDKEVLVVLSNVFGADVFTAESKDSAALGSAYRALHGLRCKQAGTFVTYAEVLQAAPGLQLAVSPDPAATAVYTGMLPDMAALERAAAG